MTSNAASRTARPGPADALPRPLDRFATYGPYGLAVGTALCLLALVTNPVPDPSFPWFSLPEAYRLPLAQPRIEHWPVSYTVGIWLWIACLPSVFLRAYDALGDRWRLSPATWLLGLPTVAMLALTTYCRFFWPKPDPATWNAPSYTFVCWLYCSTYDPLWSNLAYAVAGLGVVATIAAFRDAHRAVTAEALFGVLALPLGVPALYDASRRASGGRSHTER
ncbi:hypothetical protein [Halosimplex marinum]|uniref:hypothetical protein n=1 Tax=Halosimplex marinum TaxID=3396620 RepID=UPI003F5489E3